MALALHYAWPLHPAGLSGLAPEPPPHTSRVAFFTTLQQKAEASESASEAEARFFFSLIGQYVDHIFDLFFFINLFLTYKDCYPLITSYKKPM